MTAIDRIGRGCVPDPNSQTPNRMGTDRPAETLAEFLTEVRRTAFGLARAYEVAAERAGDTWMGDQFRIHARDFQVHVQDLERCLTQTRATVAPIEESDSEIPTGIDGLALVSLLQAREDGLATHYQWFLREGPWRVDLHVGAVLQLGLSLVLIHRSWLLLQRARL